jgi:dolichol-phosphate mannosyltransferase
MSLSLIIPVHNEVNQIKFTLKKLTKFKKIFKKFEVIFINDFCTDGTEKIIKKFMKKRNFIKLYNNKKKGLGSAIELGIIKSSKDFVCIFMSDMSDNLNDLKKYYKLISRDKLDAVLGTRFSNMSKIKNYPKLKLILNRIFNSIVRIILLSRYNDFTNAFKIYKRKTLLKLLPIVSENFNVFLELPLKIIIRGYNYSITPINWKNRNRGKSKFRIKELGSMYLFTLFYCLLEKILLKSKK